MKSIALSAALACLQALAWGPEGHSIVAEIAQRRLSPEAAAMVEQLLGRGHSLASIASWADNVREERPETRGWHFVDIPLAITRYAAAKVCKKSDKGDCAVAELDRLKNDLRCASGEQKTEALKFAVHLIGDIHQPLHTVDELSGGNGLKVDIFLRGLKCTGTCTPTRSSTNFHAAWDEGLINETVWDWGAYVDRLDAGWLKSSEAMTGIDGGTPAGWVEETHGFARTVWDLRPAGDVLDDTYYRNVLPILDRQLGVAGLRLARFLNEAYASNLCPVQ
jgi:hypothetical protein